MPRKKLKLPPGAEDVTVNCFAFRAEIGGRPECVALRDIYCLKENKPCTFHATPQDAEQARVRAAIRLTRLRAY